MRIPGVLVLLIVGLALATACQAPPKVIQGTVIVFDMANGIMKITDESTPGAELEFSLEGAEIGAVAQPGDTIRVAYRESNGKRTATRIMKVA
jgi:hypothetical protein